MFRHNTLVGCQQDTKNFIARPFLRVNECEFAGDSGLAGDAVGKAGTARTVSLRNGCT